MVFKRVSYLVVCLLLTGCAQMLPHGNSEGPSQFDSFEAAAAAFDKIVSHRTTVEELKSLGFDLQASSNLTVIPYPQLTARLSPDPGVPFETLDPGIRECILAHQGCQAYEFHLARETSHHEGGFFLDFMNFRRTIRVSGWRFNGLVAVRDGVVLFRSYGGEPRNDRTERQVNPLGPLQPAGEAVGGLVMH